LHYRKTFKLCTFYNSDGLINWLRQPGQFCTQHLNLSGLAADALAPHFLLVI